MRILIAVPTYESIYPDVFKAIYDLKETYSWESNPCPPNEYIFEYIRGYDVSSARNKIVEKAKELNADYILMVDNDVIIPPETIELFLDDTVDVCLGAYPHRSKDRPYEGNTCICRLEDSKGSRYFNYPIESQYAAKELLIFEEAGEKKIQIHGGGMGCAFIRTSIFDQIEYPYFKWVNYEDKQHSVLSEDLYFCEQCKHLGIPVYTDVRVRAKHILRHAQECV